MRSKVMSAKPENNWAYTPYSHHKNAANATFIDQYGKQQQSLMTHQKRRNNVRGWLYGII